MKLQDIRALAKNCRNEPEIQVFYSSILYSKTLTLEDALLYAQALYEHQEYRRSVRVLEEQEDSIESVLLQAKCYAALGEWQPASQVLQDASSLGNDNMLMDDDDIGWSALVKMHDNHVETGQSTIHPIARLALWRAKCYDATSHPPRAKLFWKRALQIDPKCTAALDSLLDRNLLLPDESLHLVESLQLTEDQDWLKQVYLARLHILSTTTEEQDYENHPPHSSINVSTNTSLTAVDTALSKLTLDHGLDQSPEILALSAIRAYRRYDLQSSFTFCQELIRVDPLSPKAALVHAATLLALGYKRLLFGLAHEWVAATPQDAKAWFAVGCYYYACQRYHVAQQHFLRATRLNPQCTEAWIAFGCSFAACDESDQALASFRAAQRLGPCESSALLYMGMEYVRTNHLVLAQHSLLAALPGGDPLCLNELGVVAYAKKDTETALSWWRKACTAILQLQPGTSESDDISLIVSPYWEPTLYNLGTAFRKLHQWDEAKACFSHCLVLIPDNASAYTALGLVQQYAGEYNEAIESYHKALSIQRDDALAAEWLQLALQEALLGDTTIGVPGTPSARSTPRKRAPNSASSAFSLASSQDDVDMSMLSP